MSNATPHNSLPTSGTPAPSPAASAPAAMAFVRAVEGLHAGLAAVAVVVALVLTREAPLGSAWHWTAVLAGVALGGANFRVLGWLTAKMLLSTEPSSQQGAILMLVAKLGALAVAMMLIFRFVQPDGITLALAISLAPLALVVQAMRRGGQLTPVGVPKT